jgi:hypothetical protein
MANPLPEEEKLYIQIKEQNITIEPGIWDLIYHRLGDDITAINLLCQYYFTNKEPIPILEAEKILAYTQNIKDIVRKITMSSSQDLLFPEFRGNIPLHPIVREMFTHYIGNDVQAINFMVGDSIDSADPQPVSLEAVQRILNRTQMIRDFLERLRKATSR